MVVFPNCKINLGLRVLEKRADGYHNIETIFFPVPLRDALEAVPLSKTPDPFRLTVTGNDIPGNAASNLCTKAFELLRADFPGIPPVQMFLHKTIPAGAGLGGGSADGAFTLVLLNNLLELQLSNDQLKHYALQLGSDCPFFIDNIPCEASGRGEILHPVTVDLSGYSIVLVHPGVHISTAWAFSQLNGTQPSMALKDIIGLPIEKWKDLLYNDFEAPVFREYPHLQKIKEELNKAGAVYSSLTGTGSCIYGIFGNNMPVTLPMLKRQYKVYQLKQSS